MTEHSPWEVLLDVPAFVHSPRYRALQRKRNLAGQHYRDVLREVQHRCRIANTDTIAIPTLRSMLELARETEKMAAVSRQKEAVRER